jgi:hypothetical protein
MEVRLSLNRSALHSCLTIVACVVLSIGLSLWAQSDVNIINGVRYVFPASQGTAGKVLTNDGSGNLSWSDPVTPEGIWADAVILSLTTCPAGYTEDTSGGWFLASRPSGGTIGGTVGTALTNLENRDHTHTGPSHQHTGPSHSHAAGTLAGPSHTHTGPSHTHSVGGGSTGTPNSFVTVQSGAGQTAAAQNHLHDFDPPSTGAGGTGATGASGTGAVTGSTAADGTGATGAAGTGATGGQSTTFVPRKQFALCVKD